MVIGANLDVPRLRAETPGCAHVVHFNHAGASLMPRRVLDAVIGHTLREGEIGGYEAAAEASDRIDGIYDTIARLIGAQRTEIGLIENATRAWDMAFYAIKLRPGDRILTSRAEYSSNVISFMQAARNSVSIEVIPDDPSGQIDVAALAAMMDERVRVVAVSHMPTNGGLVQPAADIGAVTRDWPAIYILDACQSVGQLPIDVRQIGCDVLSATSRKYLRGPRGAGFLYVRDDLIGELEPPLLDNHAATWTSLDTYEILPDARRFENWERSYANLLGMDEAARLALELGLPAIWQRVSEMSQALRTALAEIDGVTCTDIGSVKSGIVTFTMAGVDTETVETRLAAERINVTVSTVASTRYDMEARHLESVVRASVHYLTMQAEIDQLIAALQELARHPGK
jgi:cysteine desulfurase/selenocysteine lyase